jgi:hypothetical protein
MCLVCAVCAVFNVVSVCLFVCVRAQQAGAVAITITRTVPVDNCKSGGMVNYEAYPSHRAGIQRLHGSWKHENEVRVW